MAQSKISWKMLAPTFIMLAFLSLVGLYLYFFPKDNQTVFWGGFFSMLFFYGAMFFIGSYVAARRKKTSSEEDVLLAGRSIPLWIAVFTMGATWVGGGYINGSAEASYASGLVWTQAPWGYALSLIVGGIFFARKMRRYRFKTMLDPLGQRFGKRMAALLFIPALSGELFWTAAILAALGSTFGVVLGLGFQESIVISAIVVIAYTALGGLWAVALTDVLQMSLLLLGLFIAVPFALEAVGGWDSAWAVYSEKHGAAASLLPSEEGLGSYYWNWWDYALLLVFGGIPWQVYFQRVLSAKNEKTAMWLSILAGGICLIAAVPAIMIGVIGNAADWTAYGGTPSEAAEILPYVIKNLTPYWVAVIGLGAVAAAVMSSADSSILSASSMAAWNIYKPLVNPNITTERLTKVIKTSIWVMGVAATMIALGVASIKDLWYLCSDFVYCLLFPALLTAMFDKKANTAGALAGFLVAAILRFGGGDATLGIPVFIDYPIIDATAEIAKDGTRQLVLFPFRTLAMVSGLITIVIVSRLTQKITPPQPLVKVE